MTFEAIRMTSEAIRMTSEVPRMTSKAIRMTSKAIRMTSEVILDAMEADFAILGVRRIKTYGNSVAKALRSGWR